jgi:outer membrane protein OmpA-like peptidoglycan-associated protein
MSFNLLDTVKNYFNSEIVNQASSALGESSGGISKALSAIIPAGLAGIVNKATSGSDEANNILSMAKDAAGKLPSSPNFNNLSAQQVTGGGNILSNLFGGNQPGITGLISRFAGVKDSSVSSLMSMGLPAIFGLLGKHVQQNNMSASGLSSFLSSQKEHIINALPSGLSSLAGMLGLGGVGATASSMASDLKSNVVNRTTEITEKTGGNKWLWPLIIILILIALIWYFSRSCNKTPEATTIDTSAVTSTDTSGMGAPVTSATTPESIKVKLPNGKELDAYKGGIEDQLVTFLSGNWKSLSNDSLKAKWFNFDNLNFNTGNATLMEGSEKQLNNIAEILKAFPDAKIKIGGYTDATGNAASNKKLSQDRANTAKDGLSKLGVAAQVTGAEGYGSEFAKFPASASEEDRATDRHVSVSVRK